MQAASIIADDYQQALGHLNEAMNALADSDDTLALAVIAQAIAVVERASLVRGIPRSA